MTNRRPTLQLLCALAGALTLTIGTTAQSAAQHGTAHADSGSAQMTPTSEFIKTVRAATERFKDVATAEAEGYSLMFGCVSGPDWGAMGLPR